MEPIDAERVAAMTQAERRDLQRLLHDVPHTDAHTRRRPRVSRRLFLVVTVGSAVSLVAWVVYLGATLTPPSEVSTGQWRLVWIGLDVAEMAGLALMAWAAWRRRMILIPAAVVTGTLLVSDAWFDLVLSWGTDDWLQSLLAAVLVEIPLAALFWGSARRISRASLGESLRLLQLPLSLTPPDRRQGRARAGGLRVVRPVALGGRLRRGWSALGRVAWGGFAAVGFVERGKGRGGGER
jgi:hypothetical protein